MNKNTKLMCTIGAALLCGVIANAQSKLTIRNESWSYFSNPAIVSESIATGGWALTEGIVSTGRGGFDNYGVKARAVGGTNYNVGCFAYRQRRRNRLEFMAVH
jgi:hypothetical protein